ERRIPRGDHTDGANGPAHRVVDVVGRGERDTILRVWSTISVKAEVLRTSKCRLAHESQRLTGVERFNDGNLFRTGFDRVGDCVQNFSPLLAADVRPITKGAFCSCRGC